jgi:hypothetical protein
MNSPRTTTVGTVNAGATAITVDAATFLIDGPNGPAPAVAVTLTADYTLARPDTAWPSRPSMTGNPTNVDYAGRVILAGATIRVMPQEAAALIAANAAIYA